MYAIFPRRAGLFGNKWRLRGPLQSIGGETSSVLRKRVRRFLMRRLMEPTSDQVTAYHEAGHAVLALVLGRPVQCVSILPNREHLGVCEFGKGVYRPSEDWLEREILIALGGIAAEARLTGIYAWDAASRDQTYVRQLAVQRAGERRAEKLQRRLLAKAEHLLADAGCWRAVELIAAELLRHREISGRTARHLFERGCREGTACL